MPYGDEERAAAAREDEARREAERSEARAKDERENRQIWAEEDKRKGTAPSGSGCVVLLAFLALAGALCLHASAATLYSSHTARHSLTLFTTPLKAK